MSQDIAPDLVTSVVKTKSLRPGGHFRGGYRHPAGDFTSWPSGIFTRADLERFRADPDLVVVEEASAVAETTPPPEASPKAEEDSPEVTPKDTTVKAETPKGDASKAKSGKKGK